MQPRKAKVPFIIGMIAAVATVILFMIGRHQNPYCLWAGLGAAVLALCALLMALTRFLRNRSIVSGLFLSTTAVTVIYFVGNQFVGSWLPMMGWSNATVAPAEAGAVTTTTNPGWFTPLIFAQIGLFVLWFLLILFIIYVYVRPIKKIDLLLGQIIDAQQIKKLRLGKGKQYRNIAAKLQILADEKYHAALQKQARRLKSRTKAAEQRQLVKDLIKEQQKIPKPQPTE